MPSDDTRHPLRGPRTLSLLVQPCRPKRRKDKRPAQLDKTDLGVWSEPLPHIHALRFPGPFCFQLSSESPSSIWALSRRKFKSSSPAFLLRGRATMVLCLQPCVPGPDPEAQNPLYTPVSVDETIITMLFPMHATIPRGGTVLGPLCAFMSLVFTRTSVLSAGLPTFYQCASRRRH